jgi:hypothetical protein
VTFDQFKETLTGAAPPDVSSALRALWHDGRGDWDAAHTVAQDIDDATGAWIHAYLHRKKATWETQPTGTTAPANRLPPIRSTPSGSGS